LRAGPAASLGRKRARRTRDGPRVRTLTAAGLLCAGARVDGQKTAFQLPAGPGTRERWRLPSGLPLRALRQRKAAVRQCGVAGGACASGRPVIWKALPGLTAPTARAARAHTHCA